MVDGTRTSCQRCPIRHNAVCCLCDERELAFLDRIKSYRTVANGEYLGRANQRMSHVSTIVSGVALITRSLPDGRQSNVGLLLPSDFIGRPGRSRSVFDIRARSELLLCCFQRQDFEALLQRSLHVNRRLLEITMDELDAARLWMSVLGRKTSSERVASFILFLFANNARLNERRVRDVDQKLWIPLSRLDMAEFLGLTLETVSRRMSELRRDRLIDCFGPRVVRVRDYAGLVQAAAA